MMAHVYICYVTFEEYLINKKINADDFRKHEPARWEEFYALFGQVHPNSFTSQKLFLINQIRRKYPYREVVTDAQAKPKKTAPKPVVKKSAGAVKKPLIKPKLK